MDERREQIERIRAEIERELAAGLTLEPADWLRRYPELQPELGELLAELFGGRATLGPRDPGTGLDPTVATIAMEIPGGETVAMSSSGPAVDPDATTALGGPLSPDPAASPGDETLAQPVSEFNVDPDATTALGGPTDPTGGFDPMGDMTTREHRDGPGSPADGTLPRGQKVRYIGDYELVGVLGRGGMGVVYRARQISLNRPVALKMINNAEFASDEMIRRFQNEAEAVATLDHVGIVPIYEVGTFQDQRYFSMKLIDGRGMEKALADLKANPRETARIVAEIADAVHHAHQRGILHRDLKPANILLDPEHHAHVTDFGLAKRIETEEGMTVTGAVLGTPAYMSPEQAAGQTSAITTATDVYGIGAILFAALTDRAPFIGNSLMMTLDRVRNTPPDAPHRLNPGVPRDLEVICLKCLEKEPRQRYASAQDLAADLRRWLAGEPIEARPVGPGVRLAMWARRKPALAGLSVALIVASILGVAGIAWQWREAVYARDEAVVAREDAVRQEGIARDQEKIAREQATIARAAEADASKSRDAAQASEKVAVAAQKEAVTNYQTAALQAYEGLLTIQYLIDRVQNGLDRPDLYDLKTDILKQALDRVEKVDNIYKGAFNKESTTFSALYEIGKIYRQTGRIAKAADAFGRCLAVARDRIIIKKGSDPARFNLVLVLGQLAACSLELDRDLKASIAYELEALAVLQEILDHPMRQDRVMDRKLILRGLGDHHRLAALAFMAIGELGRSLEEFRRAFNVDTELLAGSKVGPALTKALTFEELLKVVVSDALALGNGSFLLGRREAAEEYFRISLDHIQQFDPLRKGGPEAKTLLCMYRSIVGLFHFRTGRREEARREYEAARDDLEALRAADPQNSYLRIELVQILARLGRLEEVEGKPEPARAAFEQAARLADELFRVDEKNDRRRMSLVMLLPRVGQVDRGANMADQIAAGPRVDAEIWVDLACCYAQCAKAQPLGQALLAKDFQDKAIKAVAAAIQKGFREKISLEVEPDLDPIRHREEFQTLLKTMPPPA